MSRPAFTPEQRAAIRSRTGASLLAANAGSGKTAVMVERFAAAVIEDGVPVGGILALTFTEKAAGEFAERLKRRLSELGETEHARAVDAAWIGTIHGFCARVLRTQPLAAGLDPRFEVLDEPAAARVAGAAYEEALNAWARGPEAIDLAASYGASLRDLLLGAYASLRARGHNRPRLAIPAEKPSPDPAVLMAACEAAVYDLRLAGSGVRVSAARDALAACRDLLAPAADGAAAPAFTATRVPWPGELGPAELKRGAKALESEACEAYREAWAAYRAACGEHHARSALALLDGLLDRFGHTYEAAKAARAAVDFEDLELRVRDLLADPVTRDRWAERFSMIMVDEFQDTNGVQLEILEALERDNLFAVGDEFQSIYRFRHADVGIFRARAATLGADRVRGLAVNFRSREELLDVLNATFARELGERFSPLRAGRVEVPEDGVLRLFDLAPPSGAPPVELLVTDTKGWDGLEERLGLAGGGDNPWRRAEARLVAHRLREEVDAGRRPGDCVVLVRATGSLRLLEQALEEQGLPTYVVGGRGYWSQEQVRDGLAWLRVLANPRDEAALLTVLASPFCGAGADALILLAEAGREREGGERRGLWDALQEIAAQTEGAEIAAARGGPADAEIAAARGGPADAEIAALRGGPADAEIAAARGGPADAEIAAPRGVIARLSAVASAEVARIGAVGRLLAAEREQAERAPLEVLLERAIAATGYDLAVLARPGGDRRLANLRKLMRLAREYERAEGRDLRGFLADAAARDLAEAREGEAALESEGLDAVRLMTIHRAKGLEFPVVCVADLGRQAGGRRSPLLVGRDGSPGLRLYALGGGDSVPTPAWERLAEEEARADAEEERRLFYVAMTRARELLILSGGTDTEKWPAARPGGPPIDWIARAVAGDPATVLGAAGDAAAGGVLVTRHWDHRPARVLCRLNSPATLSEAALSPKPPARSAPTTALPAKPAAVPRSPARPRPVPQRLSYSQVSDYAKCGYRFYLRRVLRLPELTPPPPLDEHGREREPGLDPRVRGSIVHAALEEMDLADPRIPGEDAIRELSKRFGADLTGADVEDIRELTRAFAASPLRQRLASATRIRREAGFAFTLDQDGAGPLVNGFVDVVAQEPDGTTLVVDYKSDRLNDDTPQSLVEREYETQRIVYALAALRDGAPRVEVAHLLLERPDEPVTATYTQDQAPDLAARLARLAKGILEHRYPVTDRPHRELCGECPGRTALCSHPESRTLSPLPPAPSPAVPVRRS
ncbi:UvrD-helicase domain-containing protein [Candidatus Solirubrobacter pratensis]|uniref:UvrD-helicase domain-containing protein n=1 Tax=Candidatus Solirubrobacter pratensis TaxID=1298857 RepID=UPI00040A396E|nr:UvrD-helicase domain-containing protein [Candidatus Solirubrobacter pratensis]